MRSLRILTIGLLLIPVVAPADNAPQPATTAETEADGSAQPDLFAILTQATEDQRARMRRFMDNRYPNLGPDLYAMLQARHPGLFSWAGEEVRSIILMRYPRLSATVERELNTAINERYPRVRQEIADLIREKYPDLIEALNAAGPEIDPASEMARLIKERHRALLADVLTLLREQHPDLLEYVHERVTSQHPELILDVAGALMARYPGLSGEVAQLLNEKYPELLPGLLAILREEPAPVEDAGPPLDEEGEPMDQPGDI